MRTATASPSAMSRSIWRSWPTTPATARVGAVGSCHGPAPSGSTQTCPTVLRDRCRRCDPDGNASEIRNGTADLLSELAKSLLTVCNGIPQTWLVQSIVRILGHCNPLFQKFTRTREFVPVFSDVN